MVSGDTCLIVKNWTFLPARHWRRHQWFRRFRPSQRTARNAGCHRRNEDKVDGYRRHWRCGSIHQRRTVVSSSGILYRCPSYLSPFPVGPFLSSFSVLHPSFLLSLNSRRATARTFPVTFSLFSSTSLGSFLPPFSRLFVSLLRALLLTLLQITEIQNCIICDTFSSLRTKIIYFRSIELNFQNRKCASLLAKDICIKLCLFIIFFFYSLKCETSLFSVILNLTFIARVMIFFPEDFLVESLLFLCKCSSM